MARVVVVGAGAAGLAVAARLGARRHTVTVVEAGPRTGGKLHTLQRDGFAFDTGPSLFTLPAVYRDLFLKTGRPLEDEIDLQPVEPGFRYRFADGTAVTLPGVGTAAAANALGESLGGSARADWLSLMARAGAMWRLTRGPVLASPVDGWRSLAGLARKPADIRTISAWRTLEHLGRSTLRDWRLRQLLCRYATYTGSDPRRAPAVLATVPYVEQTFGIWHIGGGLGALAAAMTRRVERIGVTLRLGEQVAQILTDGQRVTGVRTADGTRLQADIVVTDVDARTVYNGLLDPAAARAAGRQARAAERPTASMSGFTLLLALRGRSADPVHHEVLFPDADGPSAGAPRAGAPGPGAPGPGAPGPSERGPGERDYERAYDAEFDDVFGARRHPAQPVRNPAVYICNPQDPAMRPEGHESLFVMVNAPRHGTSGRAGTIDWDAPGVAASYAAEVLAVMARRGRDVRDRIVWMQVNTPADLERSTGSPGGSIYGNASHGARSGLLKPANASPVAGLFLVGGSVHPGGGLPLVGLSAEIVSDLVGRA